MLTQILQTFYLLWKILWCSLFFVCSSLLDIKKAFTYVLFWFFCKNPPKSKLPKKNNRTERCSVHQWQIKILALSIMLTRTVMGLNTFSSCSGSANAHPTLCSSHGHCHMMVVSDRYRAETGYRTHKIHPLLTARAEHRACCNMHRVKYLFRLLRRCWRFACWEDMQQATLEDAAIHSRHGSACILRLCKLHIPNAS